MSPLRTLALALCVLLFFASGCSSTKKFYNTHINRPARLKFDNSKQLEPYQAVLVEAVAPVDFELEELLRVMDDSDRSPDEDWVRGLTRRFPWLSGTFMADSRGRIMSRVPSSGTQLPDFSQLLVKDEKQRQTDLRAAILPGPGGPEIYLAKPVYLQEELRVLIVCHFDIRNLLARFGEPEKFMIYSGQNLLWSGVYNPAETPLENIDWNELALKRVDGIERNENGRFYWLASYFANIQLVYATPVDGTFTVDPARMSVLRSPRFAGTGR